MALKKSEHILLEFSMSPLTKLTVGHFFAGQERGDGDYGWKFLCFLPSPPRGEEKTNRTHLFIAMR